MVNKVTLIGRLGGDPEVRRLENGAAVARFGLATNESYKDNMGNWQDRTEWHNVTAWRALAERAESSLKKGALVYVEGKLQTRKWTDGNNIDRRTTDIVASYFRILTSSQGGGSSINPFPSTNDEPIYSGTQDTQSMESPTTMATVETTPASSGESTEDDLPF